MARAELNDNREPWEVGQAIVAAWFKVLSRKNALDRKIGPEERAELRHVFGEIFKTKIYDVVIDPRDESKGINIVVPQPPVDTPAKLVEYLRKFHQDTGARQFHEEMGGAVIFGCGKR